MRSSLAWPLLAVWVGCATAPADPDAAVDASPIDARPPIDAPRIVILNQTDNQTVTPQASVACTQAGPPQVSKENSYYRVFTLADWAIDRPFTPTEVKFGIEQATAALGSQAVQVKLYTLTGPLQLANLTPVSTLPFVRARYGAPARGWTSQSRQKAR